jgi:SAM-dependent methyltransferase
MEIQEAIDLIKGAWASSEVVAPGGAIMDGRLKASASVADSRGAVSSQIWADLGCGEGLFTYALSTFLPQKSQIYAVDQRRDVLRYGPFPKGIKVHRLQKNFVTDMDFQSSLDGEDIQRDLLSDGLDMSIPAPGLPMFRFDGLLMANSLHYVKDQGAFLQMIQTWMMETGIMIFVEYDSDQSNPWVPYPLSFASLSALLHKNGFKGVKKLGQRPSLFGRAMIYSALARI